MNHQEPEAWKAWALLFARLVLGLIFMMAGVFKVFDLGVVEHARRFFLPFEDTFLPTWSLWLTGTVIPLIELVAGALIIVGYKTRWAAVSLGWVLAIVTFGHLLKEPLYAFHQHVFPRLVLVLFILATAEGADCFSLDFILRKK